MKKFREKFFNSLKENKFIWLTFLIATLIFVIVFSLKSIIPIGSNTMLTVDFYHQYGPLLSELYDRITSGANLTYSFSTGLGLPIFRNFFNYLSSPFNIIMLFFSRSNIVTAFSIIIALKIIVASTIMAYFLKNFFNKNSIATTIFGLAYGFSSYFVAFYWNIMWLDSLVILPLVVLGIKKLIDEDKINLYILSLFLGIISNYFISYMICIFSCLFFIVYIIFKDDITRKGLIKKILLFTISSLIAGGLTAFMLIPYVTSLSTISATGDSFTFYKTFNFNIIDFFANHISLVDSVVFSSQDHFLPNVSSGIIVFSLFIAFFFNSDIKVKHKFMAAILILFLIISFIYVPLDFIWHGFHTPNDLPFRYSFIYVFSLNTIAFYSFTKIDKLRIRYSLIIFIGLISFVFYLSKTGFITQFAYNVNILFLFISLIIFIIYKLNKNDIGKYILLFLIFIDIILNIRQNWKIDHDKEIFMDNYVTVNEVINHIKENDNSLYRIEKDFNQTLNDGAWYNYNGLSIFSSVAYEQMAKTQKKLGIAGNNINSYYYRQNTPIYNSIMSLKYLVNIGKDNEAYNYIETINGFNIYKNNYYLPIGFAVDENIKTWLNGSYNPFMNQQEFVKKATSIDKIFEEISFSYDKDQDYYTFSDNVLTNLKQDEQSMAFLNITTNIDGNVYICVNSYGLQYFFANDQFYSVTTNEPYIIDIGYFKAGDIIKLNIPLNPNTYMIEIYSYQMNQEKFLEFYNILDTNSLQITNFKDDYIEGVIDILENKTIFTSIPYDEGFKVYVDDKEVEIFNLNAFLAFDVSKGTHNIKIVYNIEKLPLGIIISLISLGLFIIINIIKKKNKN